jgi:predicted RecA/RadA family phage recombinase
MKNFIQPGNIITLVAPTGGAVSGEPVIVGAFFGIAAYTAAAGQPVETQLTGVFELPKDTVVAINQGDQVYWDAGNQGVTNISTTSTILIGACTESVIGSAPTVRVRLKGTAGLDEDD